MEFSNRRMEELKRCRIVKWRCRFVDWRNGVAVQWSSRGIVVLSNRGAVESWNGGFVESLNGGIAIIRVNQGFVFRNYYFLSNIFFY